MKANTNSLHAKLYSVTYDSQLPNSLCPYFWKLLFAVIMFIPNIIIQTPVLILDFFQRNSEHSKFLKENPQYKQKVGEKRTLGFGIYIFILFLALYSFLSYQMIRAIFNCYSYNSELALIGSVLNCIFITVLLIWLVCKWINHIKDNSDNNGIIIEFVKAKYNNYCPKIDWDKE